MYYYKKPTNMKTYSVVTAVNSGVTWTGTSTYWLNNKNVEAGMFIAYQSDVRTDGTYPWAKIATVTANTTLTTDVTYTGALATGAYYASSESTFTEVFDLAIIYGTCLMMSAKLREIPGMTNWLKEQYKEQLSFLSESQTSTPDHAPVLEDFTLSGAGGIFSGMEYKYPFIGSSS
jgi:hypothetical protein